MQTIKEKNGRENQANGGGNPVNNNQGNNRRPQNRQRIPNFGIQKGRPVGRQNVAGNQAQQAANGSQKLRFAPGNHDCSESTLRKLSDLVDKSLADPFNSIDSWDMTIF